MKTIIYLFFFSVIISCKPQNEFFPESQGLTWTYSINLVSSYTGKKIEKRIFISNIKTHKKKDGTEVVRLYSNGNFYKYWIDRFNNKLTRDAVLLVNKRGLREPIKKEIYPDLNFENKSWEVTEQLFLTKGYQPPVRNFKPDTTFQMNYYIKKQVSSLKHNGEIYKNCFNIFGNGKADFIADDRSGPLEVKISSEEWICDGVGTVIEKRSENTEASAFGNSSYIKELIVFNKK